MTPEQEARAEIDRLLTAAGWHECDCKAAEIHAARGVAIREFELVAGHGTVNYPLYLDCKAARVIGARKKGATRTGVEIQAAPYSHGLPAPAWRRPTPFACSSTVAESRFTNQLNPEPRTRNFFAFHPPTILSDWLEAGPIPDFGPRPGRGPATPATPATPADTAAQYARRPSTFLDYSARRPRGVTARTSGPRRAGIKIKAAT